MPEKTPIYKLDYFKQGSYYSAAADFRRFVTLDYNLQSYVGVSGIGIIKGWNIESVSGLQIKILPGNGIIDGYFSESPYIVKQRSDMVAGEREADTVKRGEIPEQPLTTSQRAYYVYVIQLYDPSFNPIGDIENAYVKVVIPTVINLPNNTDTYIYAKRPSGAKPYPILSDYPPQAGPPPNRGDYNLYDDYKAARDVYESKLQTIHDYQWYDNPVNHFTAVEFEALSGFIKSTSKVLLGRVVTRNNNVFRIDTSSVENLSNFESQIKNIAREYIVQHNHGGNKAFDPPKIRLETDIRETSLWSYNSIGNRATYKIL
jgi:hypothetical protein